MDGARLYIVVLCVFLLLAPAGSFAADDPAKRTARSATTPAAVSDNGALVSSPHGFLGRIDQPYRPATLPPPSVSNSDRLDSLHAGRQPVPFAAGHPGAGAGEQFGYRNPYATSAGGRGQPPARAGGWIRRP